MKDIQKRERKKEEYKIINGEKVPISRKKRRRNMSLYYLIAFIFVTIALIVLSLTVFFNVRNIEIDGTDLYSDKQILEVANITNEDNLIRLNTKDIKNSLLSSFSFFEDVKVTRSFPSTLKIDITQAEEFANILNKDKTFTVISKTGRILETGLSKKKSGIMTITGIEIKDNTPGKIYEATDEIKTTILNKIFDQINELKMKKISKINMTNRTDIRMLYNGKVVIEIGSSIDIPFKLKYINAVLKKLPNSYSGTLIYHNATSGISAIPNEKAKVIATVTTTAVPVTNEYGETITTTGEGETVETTEATTTVVTTIAVNDVENFDDGV